MLVCRFYKSKAGSEPVRQWLRSMPKNIRQEVGDDLLHVQMGWPLGKPYVDGLGGGLYELRSTVQGVEFRIYFSFHEGAAWMLHGTTKKSTKAAKGDLDLARARKKEIER